MSALLVADTSPIISLLLIEQLDLLEQLFPDFLLPQAVWQELNTHREIAAYQPGLASLAERVRKVVLHFSISGIEWGETEAILLYQEVEVDYLLIDDRKAREKAELLGSVAWGRWVCSIWHGSAEWLMPYALCFQRCCRTAVTTLKPI